MEEGRKNLEKAFTGDPFNLWFKNTLDLLDTFSEYRTVETPHFRLVLHESEADLLAPYMEPIAERAHAEMSRRYGTAPEGPIRVEVYPPPRRLLRAHRRPRGDRRARCQLRTRVGDGLASRP